MGFAHIFAHIYKNCSNWVAKRQYGKTPPNVYKKPFIFLTDLTIVHVIEVHRMFEKKCRTLHSKSKQLNFRISGS